MNPVLPLLLVACLAASMAARADEALLEPFTADYDVHYGSVDVGSSRTRVQRSGEPGQWIIESHSSASGLARLVASGTLLQRSTFELDAAGVRPVSYRFDDGTKRSSRDVQLEFDWRGSRVRGIAEDEPVDIAAAPGLQDAASIQALVLARLRRGVEPGAIDMIEKDRIKRYEYTLLRRERLKTAIGEFDTVVYRSARNGSGRETLFWYAPALGYALVQAEQRRDGKRAFQTFIRRFQQQG
jgi:hypothetical protein